MVTNNYGNNTKIHVESNAVVFNFLYAQSYLIYVMVSYMGYYPFLGKVPASYTL